MSTKTIVAVLAFAALIFLIYNYSSNTDGFSTLFGRPSKSREKFTDGFSTLFGRPSKSRG